jgi:hypothetical protein
LKLGGSFNVVPPQLSTTFNGFLSILWLPLLPRATVARVSWMHRPPPCVILRKILASSNHACASRYLQVVPLWHMEPSTATSRPVYKLPLVLLSFNSCRGPHFWLFNFSWSHQLLQKLPRTPHIGPLEPVMLETFLFTCSTARTLCSFCWSDSILVFLFPWISYCYG